MCVPPSFPRTCLHSDTHTSTHAETLSLYKVQTCAHVKRFEGFPNWAGRIAKKEFSLCPFPFKGGGGEKRGESTRREGEEALSAARAKRKTFQSRPPFRPAALLLAAYSGFSPSLLCVLGWDGGPPGCVLWKRGLGSSIRPPSCVVYIYFRAGSLSLLPSFPPSISVRRVPEKKRSFRFSGGRVSLSSSPISTSVGRGGEKENKLGRASKKTGWWMKGE